MSLSLVVEQRLQKVGLNDLFTNHQAEWTSAAEQAHDFVKKNFPLGAKIRPDDVAKALTPVLEVEERLTKFLGTKKLTQKYWVKYFVDLVIDRTWDQISS